MRTIVKRTARGTHSVRITSIGSATARRADTSRQIEVDHAIGLAGSLVPIKPTYDIKHIDRAFERSNILQQCVEAIATNVAMHGWDVVPAVEGEQVDPEEAEILKSFVFSPNYDQSLSLLAAGVVHNYERRGFAFVEFIRDISGRVSILRLASSITTKLCPKNTEPVLVRYDIARGKKVSTVQEYRTFRLFVQQVGGKKVYFKEFGDPRKLNRHTGVFAGNGNTVSKEDEATEILHYKQGTDDVYGIPRWISQLPSILGSREVEEVNLRYFEDNMVPSMILSVAGGRLTAQSYKDLRKQLDAQGVGKDRQNRIMLVEAVAEKESIDDKGTVTLKVDKLTDARPTDGLFASYDDANQGKVMSSFRLPPIAVGKSADHNFATANTAMFVAESQVYAPERKKLEEFFNKFLVWHVNGLNLKTVALRCRAPTITNPETLVKTLTALNVMGALTPRMAQEAMVRVLQLDIVPYPEEGEDGWEEWMDQPLALSLKSRDGSVENTHDEQSLKDNKVKDVEAEGNVAPSQPEHGEE